MPLTFNIRHLQEKDLVLEGKLPVEELDLAGLDDLIRVHEPLQYRLVVENTGTSVLVRGRMSIVLDCDCARCLKPFDMPLVFDDWMRALLLEGEDKVLVENDLVNLTPFLREDILLGFPQHPLCKPDCPGMPQFSAGRASGGEKQPETESSAWDELNKLKL